MVDDSALIGPMLLSIIGIVLFSVIAERGAVI